MIVEQIQFDGSETLVSELPDTVLCSQCAYSEVDVYFYDNGETQTFHGTLEVSQEEESLIPIHQWFVDYFEQYQTSRFMGDISVQENGQTAAYWQVDIIDSILAINNILSSACFTSELADSLSISSNAVSLTVKVTCGSDIIHSATYAPYENLVEVYDFGSLLESYMLSHSLSGCRISVVLTEPVASRTYSLAIYYCRRHVTGAAASDYFSSHFATGNTARLTSPSVGEVLPLILDTAASSRSLLFSVVGTYLLADGSVSTCSFLETRTFADASVSLDVSFSTIDSLLRQENATQSGTLTYYTVSLGDRRCTYYVTSAPVTRSFLFRNGFNCWETAHIFASTKAKLSTSFSSTSCGDRLIRYDIEHTVTCEEQTSALLLAHALWLREFLTSPDIRLLSGVQIVPDGAPEVLIESYTSEISDAPSDSANTVTFEWRFASLRGWRSLSGSSRTFTEQFTSPFE